jgi:beta-mannanase
LDDAWKLQDAGIAATWRPFHEAAGNATYKQQAAWTKSWFWWGYDGADVCKKLWITMFDYFKSKGVNNLIWIWTTQNYNGDANQYNADSDWYPGDQYVDIIGRDLYGYTASKNEQEFREIQARYPNKMVVLSECGIDNSSSTAFANISDCWNTGAKWGHFMVWYGANLCNNSWWSDALKNSNVITRDQLPSLK